MTDEPEKVDRRRKEFREATASHEAVVTYSPALDHDEDGKNGGSKAKWFPVKLKKNYRPGGPYQVLDLDGDPQVPDVPPELAESFGHRIVKGWTINLQMEEAKNVIRLGIADRADPLE